MSSLVAILFITFENRTNVNHLVFRSPLQCVSTKLNQKKIRLVYSMEFIIQGLFFQMFGINGSFLLRS